MYKCQIALRYRYADIGCRRQLLRASGDQFAQTRFADRRPALIDRVYIRRIQVHADHLMAAVRHHRSQHGAQLPQSDDRNIHFATFDVSMIWIQDCRCHGLDRKNANKAPSLAKSREFRQFCFVDQLVPSGTASRNTTQPASINSAVLTCPKCKSCNFTLSQRKSWERPFRILLIRAFRCRSCGQRSLLYYGPPFAIRLPEPLREASLTLHRHLKAYFRRVRVS